MKMYKEWMGLVKWADIPFSTSGDSGSLVFALESGYLELSTIRVE
jgi:hypothetical protein